MRNEQIQNKRLKKSGLIHHEQKSRRFLVFRGSRVAKLRPQVSSGFGAPSRELHVEKVWSQILLLIGTTAAHRYYNVTATTAAKTGITMCSEPSEINSLQRKL